MATLINQDGTDKADSLKYDVGGSGIVFNTGAGADTVSITGGTILLNNKGGNDVITITGGSGHSFTSGEGNFSETLEIKGGNAIEAQLGSGKDTIVIMASDGRKATGGSSSIRGGDWGDTFNTNDGVQNYQLYGDAGDDIFNINGGKNMNFWGGAANDTFVVKGGTNNKLYGGDSADKFEIYVADQNIILGYGNDIVNIYKGDGQQIKGNLGINTVNLMAGSGHSITADIDQAASKKAGKDVGYGQDKVYISGTASAVTANLGDGKDVVEVSSGSKHQIFTEGWGDTILISGTTKDSSFDAGDGDDTISVSGGTGNVINAGAGADTIKIAGGTGNSVYCNSGRNTVEVSNAQIKLLNLGEEENSLVMKAGATIDSLELSTAANTIDWYGGAINSVSILATNGGYKLNTFNFKGAEDVNLSLARGVYEVNVSDGSNLTVKLADGKDRITISDGYDLNIDSGSGNDVIEIFGGSKIKATASGSTGNNSVYLYGGQEIEYTCAYKGDEVFISGGQDIMVKGGSNVDRIAISGGVGLEIKGGTGNDVFLISGGDQVYISGDAGSDTYRFQDLTAGASYTIDETSHGSKDTEYLDFTDFSRKAFAIEWTGTDAVMTHENGATVTIKNWNPQMDLALKFSDTAELNWNRLFTEQPEYQADTQVGVITNLLDSLKNSTLTGFKALDEAVYNSSMGRYNSFTKLVAEFKQLILEADISSQEEAKAFYEANCGIIMDNADTGSILGSDCGGSQARDAIGTVPEPEGTTVADFVYEASQRVVEWDYQSHLEKEFYAANTNEGITYYWSEDNWENLQVSREILEQIVGGLVKVWSPTVNNMLEEAYSLSLTDENSRLHKMEDGSRGIQLEMYYSSTDGVLAAVNSTNLQGEMRQLVRINVCHFQRPLTQVDGEPSSYGATYLDRILAHEFTHAITQANIDMTTTPKFIVEGLAELTHGVDDFRYIGLMNLVNKDLMVSSSDGKKKAKNQAESLDIIYNLTSYNQMAEGDMSYCGGYALLRYYAKQVMDYATSMEINEVSHSPVSEAMDKDRQLLVFGVD